MVNLKLAEKKQTRKLTQISIDDYSSDKEWIMEDEYEHNEALNLDVNLVLVEVEEDETLHSQDLHMIDLNEKRDENDGVEISIVKIRVKLTFLSIVKYNLSTK